MATKVILDTDIGSDIDDAVCLAYLLAQSECNLLGITTVTGEGLQRARMADAMCKVAGRDIPIYTGLENPLLVPARQPKAPQASALHKWPHRQEYPKNQAIEFLLRIIHQNPGEVVLLAIGPLTNVAAMFTIDPEVPSLLKALVIMGGNFTPIRGSHCGAVPVEWNILNDPHAAAIVYRARTPVCRSVGLDVTTQVTMAADEVRDRFQNKLLRPVLDFSEVWFKGNQKQITFHDPLAAATIFDDQICGFEKGAVEIELISDKLQGFTFWHSRANPSPHEVARTVDVPRFFEHYFSVFQ